MGIIRVFWQSSTLDLGLDLARGGGGLKRMYNVSLVFLQRGKELALCCDGVLLMRAGRMVT